ncbi:hypothetical protein BpHYR1_017156 [Brachionus plicatilis]|uniref:Uncharacterized protein n=1 Tax=Brachionus plicatilis TaxID=10195 RepID=A0A3M7SRP6_BRAPC|nr:hypothetical protein BpHYR1_017156 [Brachionus plicatilis]
MNEYKYRLDYVTFLTKTRKYMFYMINESSLLLFDEIRYNSFMIHCASHLPQIKKGTDRRELLSALKLDLKFMTLKQLRKKKRVVAVLSEMRRKE